MAKKQSSEPITDKIKRLNYLLVIDPDSLEVKKLKKEIDYFYFGYLERI